MAVLIRDHHPGYITWDAYLANEQRLAKNHTRRVSVPRARVAALCQGIVRCGACGHSMSVQYRAKGAHYDCSLSRINHVQTPGCRSVKAAGVDELVARRLLAALAPEEIALALAAADEVSERRARSDRALQLRVERARYDAVRASARFTPASPRTASSPAASRPAGRPSSANSPTPRPSSPSRPCPRRSLHASSSRRSRATCRALGSGQHIREGPQAAAARPDRRCHDHQPARGSRLRVGIRWRTGAAEQHTIQRHRASTTGPASRPRPSG